MTTLLDKLLEETGTSIQETFDDIYDHLETIYHRCELDQYTKKDLQAELKELLERMV